jgi:hypothetical protein
MKANAAPARVALGLTVKRLLILCWVLLAAPAEASQEWELISITRGSAWEVHEATGALKQNGKVLAGVLKGFVAQFVMSQIVYPLVDRIGNLLE